ncbi:MAG: hypothetical protein JSS02_03580, partial [Planctomycetes bacterium]|nr:hypothetical protein [Planctomycetota bacterium]
TLRVEPAPAEIQKPPEVVAENPAARRARQPKSRARAVAGAVDQAAPATTPPETGGKSPRRRLLQVLCVSGLLLLIACTAKVFLSSPADPDSTSSDGPAHEGPVPQAIEAPQVAEQELEEASNRFLELGEQILDAVDEDGTFPAAVVSGVELPPENRLSWLAQLADQHAGPGAPRVDWSLPWNAPQNEPFVRRRITAFQNPRLTRLTGADGFPATHFVGVAGLGELAAELPAADVRAGIFGYDRRTRLEDLHRGASQTLCVLGVYDHLGSWAAGGSPTVRGLAREPYVNGPDGFGTGDVDAMSVLMADGSVRSLSRDMDPRLLRALATTADIDGTDDLELDRGPRLTPREPAPDDWAGVPRTGDTALDDAPLEPEFAPEPELPAVRKFDLVRSLQQPILRFDQPRGKPLSEILVSVAELVGASIEYDREDLGPAAARLGEPVALKLDNTTVGDILSGLLNPAGLTYKIEGNHLRIIRREDP